MSQDQDHPMDDFERGRMPTPGRSPHNRLRSASPRTLQRSNHGRGRKDTSTPEWKWNPVHKCIVHSASACTTCCDYMLHLNEGAMDDDASYIDAGAKCSASYVSVATWKQGQEDLTRLCCKRDSLRDRLREAEQGVDSLRCEVHDMETRLYAQNSALSYTVVTKSQRPALAPAKRTNVALKPTFTLKGKAVALPTINYKTSLTYNDNKYNNNFNPTKNPTKKTKTIDSTTGRLIVTILNGTVPTCAIGPSGSNSVEGRVPDLHPASNAEFQLTLCALEQAHAERNVHKGSLLLSIWQYISNCHRTNTASRTTVQRSSLNQWRAPSWAEKLKYDPKTGTVKPMGVTKEEDQNQRAQEEKDGPTKQALLLLAISNRLGLTVNGVPDPHLGIISSPRHKDHPLLWMEWATKVTHILPKGVTLTHNGYPYERVIRGFRRFAPLFKEKKKGSAKAPSEDADCCACQRRRQIITMGIIAQTRRYNELIAQGGLTVLPAPSWDAIEFSPAVDEMDVVSKPSTSTNKGGTATLSLTRTGTPGLQPHNTAVPPATTVAGNAPAGDILDKNVDMEEPRDKEDPSRVMETDTT
ncbi:hypothetical protein PILCRDRAFT_16191 [Piloderma croceum F 1598]|uniref:Uncharacterized protein n=1 Tax=Piloderma croceum (strain F 1598) TaxID=765440 RepID=A0A0C3AEZ2_PILCF|nr:hypothetical protein PILCRDRAFT_16191 [Piloderma croceum F 1598]